MKLGDVLRKEREKAGLGADAAAARLGMSAAEYERLEAGESAAEEWGPWLAKIAVTLETPTSRLLAESGRSADTRLGQAGGLIRGHRQRQGKSIAQLAEALGVAEEEYTRIEAGDSPLESWGPRLLSFAEAVEQPIFNLFYPCGLPFQDLDDYP